MPARTLPYQGLGEEAVDLFTLLMAYVGLIGLVLIGFLLLVWVLMRVFAWAGLYNPAGPIDQRMARLLMLAILLMLVCGGVAMIFYWFYLTPRPIGQEIILRGGRRIQ